jgi:hypothetical protein
MILPGWSLLGDEILWCSNTNALGLRSPYGEWFLDLTGTRETPPYGGRHADHRDHPANVL